MSKQKKPTNLTLNAEIVAEAKALGVSLSQAAEAGIQAAVSQAKSEAWKLENADAIDATNTYVEKNGLPLSSHRLF